MLRAPFHDAIVLTGPTGSGKTKLGVEITGRLDAEIISMDSMALYRGMDLGTAKPGLDERRRVHHHLIDVLDPWESASVAWWLKQATACCQEIAARGKRVLFVGGTPLYLKALMYGMFDGPPADLQLRRRLEQEGAVDGPQALHARLARVDPSAAARLHPNDLRRLVRALEVWELTRRPISDWQRQWMSAGDVGEASPRVFWIDLPRATLYERINARVREMVEAGFVDEVRRLRQLPRPLSRAAAQAAGYREMLEHLDGKLTLDQAIDSIQRRTRQLAKRQITWFRNLPGCSPLDKELTLLLGRSTIR
jgi:tRNA dimethylallyltransferase